MSFLRSKEGIKARKKQWCCFCCDPINVGDIKDIRVGVDGGYMWTMHMHPECHAYEKVPGTVDSDWYEDSGGSPAFHREDAINHSLK